jgi:hypothetical protein
MARPGSATLHGIIFNNNNNNEAKALPPDYSLAWESHRRAQQLHKPNRTRDGKKKKN